MHHIDLEAPVRVMIAYSEVTSYALAGWDALASREGIELRVIAIPPGHVDKQNAYRVSEPRPWLLLDNLLGCRRSHSPMDVALEFCPDVILISGWSLHGHVPLVVGKRRHGAKVVVCLDTTLHHPLRQLLGRVRLHRFLRRADGFLVPGERGREFLSRWWGIHDSRIWSGLLSVDLAHWDRAFKARLEKTTWPRSFVFVGRYIDTKGVKELLEAYRAYRSSVKDPMAVRFCGKGPLREEICATEGAQDLGFVQTGDMCSVMTDSGCFVLPSHYDPWGVALLEASAAGLPNLASVGCGASVEMLRDGFNGYLLKAVDIPTLTVGLTRMHECYDEWAKFGTRSHQLAGAYSAELWASRIVSLVRDLSQTEGQSCRFHE